MRLAALAIAALMVSPALAQEALEGSDTPEFEPGMFLERPADLEGSRGGTASGEAASGESVSGEGARDDDQPGSSILVRRPGEAGIEVTPLAPPGSDLDAEQESGSELLEDDSIGLLPEPDTLPKSPDDQDGARPGFKRPPEEPTGLTRPEGIAIPIEPVATASRPGVRLRELDKMTGRTDTVEIAVGETRQIGRLKIAVEACRSPETNDPHGTFAFLKVWDMRSADEGGGDEGKDDGNGSGSGEEPEEAFSGWMFAQSPSLSALDHPRYDLWVISCTTSEVAQSSGSE